MSKITIPKIERYSVTDKCVLNNLSKEVTETFSDIKAALFETESNINKSKESLTSAMITSEGICISSTSTGYNEKFINFNNIDSKSTVDIDLINHSVGFEKIGGNVIDFSLCTVNGKEEVIKDTVFCGKSFTIDFSFNGEKTINKFCIDLSASLVIPYSLYAKEKLLFTGKTAKDINASFSPIRTNKITLFIEHSEEFYISLSNALAAIEYKSNTGTFMSKPVKLRTAINNLTVEVSSNGIDKIKPYVGFINKEDEIEWYNADETISFNLSNYVQKNIDNSSDGYGVDLEYGKSILELKKNYNQNSIRVFSGYNRYHVSVIEGAFMSSDLNIIEYGPNDIKRKYFKDIDDYRFTIKAGELVIMEHTVVCNTDFDVTSLAPIALPIAQDKTSHFRYKILVNGNKINGNLFTDKECFYKLKKGKNKISLIFNLKKEDENSDYSIIVENTMNNRRFSDNIYYKELLQSSFSKVSGDDSIFAVYKNNIIVKNATSDQSFLVEYETLIDSNIHYKDQIGQYLKAIIKLNLYADDNFSNLSINSILIK